MQCLGTRHEADNDRQYQNLAPNKTSFSVMSIVPSDIVANLLICTLKGIHHLVMAQFMPQLRGNLQDTLVREIFDKILDQKAFERIGNDESFDGIIACTGGVYH